MKKNKILRTASVMFVLTMLTTSIIGGTFAKYVTTDSAQDTARVAKFGVVATASGDLFGSTYNKVDEGNKIITYSVNGGTVSAKEDSAEVVAPGTKNDTGLSLSVAGTPEVATKVTLGSADGYANSDIYLASGTYGVMVKYTGVRTKENIGNYYTYDADTKKYAKATDAVVDTDATDVYELHDMATLDADYYPLNWTIDIDSTKTTKTNVSDVVNQLKTEFADNKEFKPNEDNTLSATITWEWPFGDSDNNAKDTILGDMIAAQLDADSIAVVKADGENYTLVEYKTEAAGKQADGTTDSANQVINAYAGTTKVACLTVAFNAAITVEQVD